MPKQWTDKDIGTFRDCRRCHLGFAAESFRSPNGKNINYYCKGCQKIRRSDYHLANKDHTLETNRKWAEANRERVATLNNLSYERNKKKAHARSRKWREENYQKIRDRCIRAARDWRDSNPERTRKSREDWRVRNPDTVRLMKRKNASRRRAAVSDGTVSIEFLRELYGNPFCFYCSEKTPRSLRTQDHLIPISRGGCHSAWNLVMACLPCNTDKGSRTAEEYLR